MATWCGKLTHLKRPWCWERLRAGGEGDDRGWDDSMASPTQWTWVWVDSRSWWWTGRPGVLWFMGSQRVGHNWATELNWTLNLNRSQTSCKNKHATVVLHFITITTRLRGASLVAQMVKRLLAMQKTQVRTLDLEDHLEKEMATHSSTLAWKISWMEEPGRLQWSQRVKHNLTTSLSFFTRLRNWEYKNNTNRELGWFRLYSCQSEVIYWASFYITLSLYSLTGKSE